LAKVISSIKLQIETSCHTASLKFAQIDETLTGLYTCKYIQKHNWFLEQPKIYIYGGPGSQTHMTKKCFCEFKSYRLVYIIATGNTSNYLLNRGKTLTISTEDIDEEFSDDYLLVIPCAANYPVSLIVDTLFGTVIHRSYGANP